MVFFNNLIKTDIVKMDLAKKRIIVVPQLQRAIYFVHMARGYLKIF